MATMKNRPVSFNLDNLVDEKRFNHVKDVDNFSGYVKKLIDRDMQKQSSVHRTATGGVRIKID
ncbi:hypothetical protein [Sediminibacillus massiliensis]|uniref:hypothetical protein n=1 Tax=Sediminibacillus massiliensis TaxID=1926277 RepID=UPI000988788B|nr:hypothetical protein [Sediminibacillus massiliensis]